MIRFIAVGDLMVDVVASGKGHSARIATEPGGSALNAAGWAAELGADATVVGRVGDDAAGRLLLSELALRGVRADVSIDPDAPTGTVLVVDGEIRADRGANARFAPEHLPELEADAVLVSGHLPPATVAAALARASAPWIALDAARLTAVPHEASVVLANEAAARRLTGEPAEEAAQPARPRPPPGLRHPRRPRRGRGARGTRRARHSGDERDGGRRRSRRRLRRRPARRAGPGGRAGGGARSRVPLRRARGRGPRAVARPC